MKTIKFLVALCMLTNCTVKRDDSPTQVTQAMEEVRYFIELNMNGEPVKANPDMAGSASAGSNAYAVFYDYGNVRYTITIEGMMAFFKQASDSAALAGKVFTATLRADNMSEDETIMIGAPSGDGWSLMGPVEVTIINTASGTTFMSENSRIVEAALTGTLHDKSGETVSLSSGKIFFPLDKNDFGFEKVDGEE
jgi:hypothetical protein